MHLTVQCIPALSSFVNLPLSIVNSIFDQSTLPPREHSFELTWTDSTGTPRSSLVGWAGGSCPNGLLEVPARFAECLGLDNQEQVFLRHVADVPEATQVFIEPASPDDWEILELHKDYLENQLLSSVCVVTEAQVIPLFMRSNIVCHVTVVSAAPAPSVRLALNSEIIIAPKVRHHPQPVGDDPAVDPRHEKMFRRRILRVQESPRDAAHPVSSVWRDYTAEIAEGVPSCVYAHPETIESYDWEPGMVVALALLGSAKRAADEAADIDKATHHQQQQQQRRGGPAAAEFGGMPPLGQHPLDALNALAAAAQGGPAGGAGAGLGGAAPVSAGAAPPIPARTKAYAFVRVYPSQGVALRHVVVPQSLRQELGIQLLTRVSLKPVAHEASPIQHLLVRPVQWEGRAPPIAVPPAQTLAAFKQWVAERSLAGSRPIAVTSGSVITLDTVDYVIYVDNDDFSPGSTVAPATSTVPYSEKWQHLLRHPYYLLSSSTLPAELTVGQRVSLVDSSRLASVEESLGLDQLSGLDGVIAQIRAHLDFLLDPRASGRQLNSPPIGGILVHGGHGCGKSQLVFGLAAEARAGSLTYTCCLHGKDLVGEPADSVRSKWAALIKEAENNSPSLVILEDLDSLVSASEDGDIARNNLLAECLIDRIARCQRAGIPVAFVATAQSDSAVHKSLLGTSLFDQNVRIPPPDRLRRAEILQVLARRKTVEIADSVDLLRLASGTEGYYGADLEILTERAVHAASVRFLSSGEKTVVLTQEDYEDAQTGFTPSSLKGVQLTQSDTSWDDIGGLTTVRETLRETLEWPTKYSRLFEAASLRLRSGLLLYGPPGCGKTILAGAVARECGLNFISVKGPELLNKYIGASEQACRDLFVRASAAKPCVLFFDEFDSIAPRRGHDSTGVTDRVVNQLLTQLDGVEGLNGVYVLAATSRPDLIDPALLRPGRLDKSLHCSIPTRLECADIFRALSRKMDVHESVDWDRVAGLCAQRTGADIQAILYNAQLDAIHEVIDAAEASGAGAEDAGDDDGTGPLLHVVSQAGAVAMSAADRTHLVRRAETIREESLELRKRKARAPGSDVQGRVHREGDSSPKITEEHLRRAIQTTQLSLPASEQARYARIYGEFISSRSGDSQGAMQGAGQRTTLA